MDSLKQLIPTLAAMTCLLMLVKCQRICVKAMYSTNTREQAERGNLVVEDLFQSSCLPACSVLPIRVHLSEGAYG